MRRPGKTQARQLATQVILTRLCENRDERLIGQDNGTYVLQGSASGKSVPALLVRGLLSGGLLQDAKDGTGLVATETAVAWLRRHRAPEAPFLAQHSELASGLQRDGRRAFVDLDESPVGALARRKGENGEAWLPGHLVEAAERIRRDFEFGQLQPRITANWTSLVRSGKRTGRDAGGGDLTAATLAARLRFEQAANSTDPELFGVVVDVCCFLKGLETVERERRWPARSAKLVLRLGLCALARHYGLGEVAVANANGGDIRHWGAQDYRPEIN